MSSNKKIFIPFVLVLLIIIVIVMVLKSKSPYTVTINKIDDQSPARILKVYKNDKEINFQEIRYTDDVFLCSSDNPSVFYGDVENEKELKVIINNNEYVIAKVIKGGENEKK